MSYPYIFQGSNLTIVVDNVPYTITRSDLCYEKLVDCIKKTDWDGVRDFLIPKQIIVNYSNGLVTVNDNKLYWDGRELHNAMTVKIISMIKEGFSVTPMINFLINLMKNPSNRAVNELYSFLEKGKLPITDDGCFLAYKKVQDDYLDVFSGTISNHVGATVTMERNQVNDDAAVSCSTGLHFCSHSYLRSFSGKKVMILKINPADVVSIPTDYNSAKGRCCKYTVVGELGCSNAADVLSETTVNNSFEKKTTRALSMTKNAIRKRAARAKKAALRQGS